MISCRRDGQRLEKWGENTQQARQSRPSRCPHWSRTGWLGALSWKISAQLGQSSSFGPRSEMGMVGKLMRYMNVDWGVDLDVIVYILSIEVS